jgi:hypothetical protein
MAPTLNTQSFGAQSFHEQALQLHPALKLSALRFGSERTPVLIADQFVAEPQRLVDAACRAEFVANSPYYPGVRAEAPAAYRQLLLGSLQQTLIEFFRLPAQTLSLSVCHFSLITTAASQLKLLQRIPHFDTTTPHALAAVHYLFHGKGTTPNSASGTAFYRHRKTGFECITPERELAYYRALESENDGPNLPKADAGYIQGSTALFEQIGAAHGVFNRIIFYPRHLLHSGIVSADTPLSADPRQGRLTISSFIDCVSD